MNWTHDGQRWTLSAAPRYAVGYRGPEDFPMFIDGHEVDSASTAAHAQGALEARYEYEEHAADLEEARLRYQQACARLTSRFPTAARDGQLASILSRLRDALGKGPAASEPQTDAEVTTDLYRRHVAPDLAVVLDASCCVVLEVTREGRTQRRIALGDVELLRGSLVEVLAMHDAAEKQAERDRYAGPREV